jgi:hypothetical protein
VPIPGAERAIISPEKVVQYLLNPMHSEGCSKARWLLQAGFEQSRPEELIETIRRQHLVLDAQPGRPTPFGRKFEIHAPLVGPSGTVSVTTIWIIEKGTDYPRLITLVPTHD